MDDLIYDILVHMVKLFDLGLPLGIQMVSNTLSVRSFVTVFCMVSVPFAVIHATGMTKLEDGLWIGGQLMV